MALCFISVSWRFWKRKCLHCNKLCKLMQTCAFCALSTNSNILVGLEAVAVRTWMSRSVGILHLCQISRVSKHMLF